MGKRLLCAALALLLSGCAAPSGGQSGSRSQPAAQSASSGGAAASSSVELVGDPASPYPMAELSWRTDMDGDGAEELVELWAEKSWFGNETEPDKLFEGTGMHPYSLRVTRGGALLEQPLGWDAEDPPYLRRCYFTLDSEYSGAFWTRDAAGLPVLVLFFDNMSQGGAGGVDVYAFALREGALAALPVPEFGVEAILNEEALTARVTVPETGLTGILDLNQWLEDRRARDPQLSWEAVYSEDGSLSWPAAPGNIDGCCSVEQGEEGVVLYQYLYGQAHMDGMGFLVTALTWDNGEAVLLDQRFDWSR